MVVVDLFGELFSMHSMVMVVVVVVCKKRKSGRGLLPIKKIRWGWGLQKRKLLGMGE